jgi:hypothetical protein
MHEIKEKSVNCHAASQSSIVGSCGKVCEEECVGISEKKKQR